MHSPQVYIDELVIVLQQYPPGVGYKACDTARRLSPDFPPSVGKVQEAAEGMWSPTRESLTWSQNWDRNAKKQLAERKAEEDRRAAETPEQRKATVEAGYARMREAGFEIGEQQVIIEEPWKGLGISREAFEALPSARPGDFEKLQRAAREAYSRAGSVAPGQPPGTAESAATAETDCTPARTSATRT